MNILLVEDDIDLAATVVDFFELESTICDHATNGVAGLSLIQKNDYDAIVLDINMPKMNGSRNLPRRSSTPKSAKSLKCATG